MRAVQPTGIMRPGDFSPTGVSCRPTPRSTLAPTKPRARTTEPAGTGPSTPPGREPHVPLTALSADVDEVAVQLAFPRVFGDTEEASFHAGDGRWPRTGASDQ